MDIYYIKNEDLQIKFSNDNIKKKSITLENIKEKLIYLNKTYKLIDTMDEYNYILTNFNKKLSINNILKIIYYSKNLSKKQRYNLGFKNETFSIKDAYFILNNFI
jgi:hypothetical protein